MNIYEKLSKVQTELKAPKNSFNSFGKYNYRSCEDILEGVKPVLAKYNVSLYMSDTIEVIGDRFYVKATATFVDNETSETISNSAYARESDDKRGMDSAQVTGATSSYARKYALNGLFLIDDTKDADTDEFKKQQDKSEKKEQSKEQPKERPKEQPQKQEKPTREMITEEQIKNIHGEMERTGILLKVVLSMFQVDDLHKLNDIQYTAIMNKFAKTPNKKQV